ncbi:hypothetical protein C7E18_24125 [Stenotrophomonas maltophilia]|nr:hypothetical protein C7E18_24125 [Stenotrophomonas maltophilia]
MVPKMWPNNQRASNSPRCRARCSDAGVMRLPVEPGHARLVGAEDVAEQPARIEQPTVQGTLF